MPAARGNENINSSTYTITHGEFIPHMRFDVTVEGPIRSLRRPIFRRVGGNIRILNPMKGFQVAMAGAIRESVLPNLTGYCFENEGDGVRVELEFLFPRPQYHFVGGIRGNGVRSKYLHHRHVSTPDVDNLTKFVLDVLTGVVYRDDCIVTTIVATKGYGATSEGETIISVSPEVIDLTIV